MVKMNELILLLQGEKNFDSPLANHFSTVAQSACIIETFKGIQRFIFEGIAYAGT